VNETSPYIHATYQHAFMIMTHLHARMHGGWCHRDRGHRNARLCRL